MPTPMFVCTRCPTDADAFYASSLGKFVEHLQGQHGLVPNWWERGYPLERPAGLPLDKPLPFAYKTRRGER